MGGGNKIRAGVLALFVIAAVLPATAQATPPTLDSVTENATTPGALDASWTLPAGMSADYVDVATTPRVDSSGDFALEVEVLYGPLAAGDATWTSPVALPPGTYYVHVAAFDAAACADVSNPACVEEFSNVVEVSFGTPAPPAHPPVLDAVTQAAGVITADWTLDPDESSSFVEVAKSSDHYPGGGFLLDNTLIWEPVSVTDETFTATQALDPGTYYVHVAGNDLSKCILADIGCFISEYSDTMQITIPPPSSGGGGGSGSAGATGSPQPKPAPVVADKATSFSVLSVGAKQRIGKLFVDASMAEAGTITVSGTVNVPNLAKVYKLKAATANATAGVSVILKPKLPKKALKAAKKALKRHKKVKAKLTITARDKFGNTKTEARTVALKP